MKPTPGALWRALLAVLAALLAAGVTITVVNDGPHHHKPHQTHKTVAVKLGGPGHADVALPPAGQAIVADTPPEAGLNASREPAAVRRAVEDLAPAGAPVIPAGVPLAAASQPGCKTALVRNQSSRRGTKIIQFFLHWTGSRSIANSRSDVDAIDVWFDRDVAQASSTWITDDDGHCILAVPVSQKAWTEAGANGWSVSVEHVNPGAGPLFTAPAGRKVVLRLMRWAHRVLKIPYTYGRIAQGPGGICIPTRAGFLAHRDGGACAGGHPDVGDFDVAGLIAEAKRGDHRPQVVRRARVACRKLTWHRRRAARARAAGGSYWSTGARLVRAHELKATIVKGHVRCPAP